MAMTTAEEVVDTSKEVVVITMTDLPDLATEIGMAMKADHITMTGVVKADPTTMTGEAKAGPRMTDRITHQEVIPVADTETPQVTQIQTEIQAADMEINHQIRKTDPIETVDLLTAQILLTRITTSFKI